MSAEAKRLIEEAETDLKAATISYSSWLSKKNAGLYPNPLATKWGAGLDKLRRARALLDPAPPPPPSPPALDFPPPVLVDPILLVPASVLSLDNTKDYLIEGSRPFETKRGITIIGGRNVVWLGGEIVRDTPISSGQPVDDAYGLYLKGQTGTVHIERLWIHGRGIGQALVLDQGLGATIQVQRSRLESLHPVNKNLVHTDGIQSWRGPKRLRLANVTIRSAGVGIQTMPHQYGIRDRLRRLAKLRLPRATAIDAWEFRNVNVEQAPDPANDHIPYALWKGAHAGGWWRVIQENVWVKNVGNLAWPTIAEWNPGGPAKVEGEWWNIGAPPGGDFCPASTFA